MLVGTVREHSSKQLAQSSIHGHPRTAGHPAVRTAEQPPSPLYGEGRAFVQESRGCVRVPDGIADQVLRDMGVNAAHHNASTCNVGPLRSSPRCRGSTCSRRAGTTFGSSRTGSCGSPSRTATAPRG